jgi:serine/threonine-protein kinase
VFVAYALAGLLRADHVASFGQELWVLIKVFAYPCFWAAQVWLLYMALEPYARRRWPHVLISWKRLLAGNLRDPLVGRDVLLGAVMGLAALFAFVGGIAASRVWGLPSITPWPFLDGAVLSSLRHSGFRVFVNLFSAVLYGMVFLFALTLLRMLVRKPWLAGALWCVLMSTPALDTNTVSEWISSVLRALILLAVLLRGGLLALVVALYFMFVTIEVPLTLDLSSWYAMQAFPVVGVLLLLVVYGFYTSLGGKPIFGQAFFED